MGDPPIMTLTRNTRNGELISLRALYIQYCVDDPTEATFCDEVFGDWYYWSKLRVVKWFQPYLKEWMEECDVRRKSLAFKAVVKEIKEDGKGALQAAKFLITDPHRAKTKENKEISKRTTEAAKAEYQDDVTRLADYMK